MAEQTNFHAVQRGAPRSFKQVSDGVINLYLYNFGGNLGVAFMEGPSNLWIKRPWNCIFRVKNIDPTPPPPPPPYILTSGFFFFPCAHPCICLTKGMALCNESAPSKSFKTADCYSVNEFPLRRWTVIPSFNWVGMFILLVLTQK